MRASQGFIFAFLMLGCRVACAQTQLSWPFGSIPVVDFAETKKSPYLYCNTATPLGNSSLMLSSDGSSAMIVLGLQFQIVDENGETLKQTMFSGPAHMVFTTATSGTISYDIVQTIKMVAPPVQFSAYKATYDASAGTLAIGMAVTLAATRPCTLLVTALFRMP